MLIPQNLNYLEQKLEYLNMKELETDDSPIQQITLEDLLYHAVRRAERKFATSALGQFDMFWVLDKGIVANDDDRDVLAVITTPVISTGRPKIEVTNGIFAQM